MNSIIKFANYICMKDRINANNLGQNEKAKNYNIRISCNIKWIIGGLIFIIVALSAHMFTFNQTDSDKLSTYISFASVLLSITLSIFAIMFTYDSNRFMNDKFNHINRAASSIIDVANKLSNTQEKLDNNIEKIISELNEINTSIKTGDNKSAIQYENSNYNSTSNTNFNTFKNIQSESDNTSTAK